MMNFYEFINHWNKISHTVNTNTYLSLNIDHPLTFQIGYHPDGHKSLVIMNLKDDNIDVPSSYAIRAAILTLINGSKVLEFRLLYEEYEELFLRLCWDMIDYSSSSTEPIKDLIKRYLSWQRLLQEKKKTVLSFQQQKGLLGELLYMQEIGETIGIQDTVKYWVGPDGSDQDYIFEESWTEVKAISAAAEAVQISSLQQLNQEKDGLLMVYMLEKTTPGQERVNLVQMVSKIRALIGNDWICRDHFEMKLFKYGYRNDEESEYDKNQFRLIKKTAYEVNGQFPRLTERNVSVGIIRCSYYLSLTALEAYRRK